MTLDRRRFLERSAQAGLAAPFLGTPFLGTSALNAGENKSKKLIRGKAEHCIVLWLGGGAAQIDTFDPKRKSRDGSKDPGSAYGSIPTAISGARVCEHLPKTADLLDRAAILRTVNHDVINEHSAAVNRMHTGRPPSGTVEYPSMGSVVAHLKGEAAKGIPKYVLMGYPTPSRGAGFLGAEAGFLNLTETDSGPSGLSRPERIGDDRFQRRRELLNRMRNVSPTQAAYRPLLRDYIKLVDQGFKLSSGEFLKVFRLENEPADLRKAYGDEFGQRCLLARRLVQAGVRFVEVAFNLNFVNGTGWDTHNDGQKNQHLLIQSLDAAFASLVKDLERNKLLDKTLILIASEFGRPGRFDAGGGRNHHAKAFSTVLAGGGLKTGRVVGETNELAEKIVQKPISVSDLFATVYAALGIDYTAELYAGSRPVPVTDRGQPVAELFG